MNRILLTLLISAVVCGHVSAANSFEVKYVSAENVYINGGSADGLAVGARLSVISPDGVKAELEVVYVSEHSASCITVGDHREINVGDTVRLKSTPPTDTTGVVIDTAAPTVKPPVAETATPPVMRRTVPVTGSVAFLYNRWNDRSPFNFDFSQTSVRLSLNARRLWGKEITLSIRARGRLDRRQRAFTSVVKRNDWQNYLWEMAVSYTEPTSRIQGSAGRILLRRASTVGYIDGLFLEGVASQRFRVGFYGGLSPDWLYGDRRLQIWKAGGYLNYTYGAPTEVYFEQTFGLATERHGTLTNRDYLFLQGRLSSSSTWGIAHTAELDINNGWRKDRVGHSLQLSNLYINGWVQAIRRVRLSLGYDNRKNYWTLETRSVADSVFDAHLRHGIRLQSDFSLPAQLYVSASAGIHKRSGESKSTTSWSASLSKINLLVTGLTFTPTYAGFDGPTARGYNYAVRSTKIVGTRHTIGLGYGGYRYTVTLGSMRRDNSWIEATWQANIGRRYWLSAVLGSNAGDDLKGTRIQTELGCRF